MQRLPALGQSQREKGSTQAAQVRLDGDDAIPVVVPVRPPRKDDRAVLRADVYDRFKVRRVTLSGRRPAERLGIGGTQGEQIDDFQAAIAPALSEADATADRGVVVGGVGRR